MKITRRQFSQLSAATALTVAMTGSSRAIYGNVRPRVVVIGGGAGGATAARYIARESNGKISVTLIEPTRRYYTCFFSNLYIGGFRDFESNGHSYETLAVDYGVNVVHDWATGIDRTKKTVSLGNGAAVPYDALVISPGIDISYDAVPGYSVAGSSALPHAWKSGTQAQLLKSKVMNMKKGGTFVMLPPPNPYRCPPGPYERVSMIAHHFRLHNPTAKIVILDPKESFSKQALFEDGWERHYPDMIEWLPLATLDGLDNVNTDTLEFETGLDTFKADAGCVIPPMTGGKIARDAGLTDKTGWAPIKPASMQSRFDDNIYVIGDTAIAHSMPKSGSAANSQGKSCAMAIIARLMDTKSKPAVYNNVCWSLIDTDDGIKIGGTYRAGVDNIDPVTSFISSNDEDAATRKQTYEDSIAWYANITADIFG